MKEPVCVPLGPITGVDPEMNQIAAKELACQLSCSHDPWQKGLKEDLYKIRKVGALLGLNT